MTPPRPTAIGLLRLLVACGLLSALGCGEAATPLAWQFVPGDRPGKDEAFSKAIPGYGTLVGKFSKGKRMGAWEGRWPDGELRFDGSFHQGRPVGQHRTFYADGTRESVRNFDFEGRLEDVWSGWHPSGEPAYKMYFDAGKRTGAWRRWHPNGTLAFRGSWVDDHPAGEWVHFASDGAVLSRHAHARPDADAEPPPKPPGRRKGRRPPNAT